MKLLEKLKRALLFPLIGIIFATSALTASTPVYAEPVESEVTETQTIAPGDPNANDTEETEENSGETAAEGTSSESQEGATCYSQVGGLGWLLCPATAFLAKGIDTIYGVIEDFLILEPISTEDNSPVFTVWLYIRNITNVVFIIFLMIIIYSQITGFGISNYGIKRALPRLLIAAILVNLSWLICVAAVDISNIVGKSLNNFFGTIVSEGISNGSLSTNVSVSFYDVFTTIAAGGVIGGLAIGLSGGPLGLLLALIPVILSGIISVIIGLVTISLRQAVIILLVAIAPLAFVAYLLPNTEKWFQKWTHLFSQMLFFYPMFAILFGASKLASGIFISGANSMLGIILGLAVQILPLFLALNMMKMAGSVLGGVSSALGKLGDKANASVRGFTEPYRGLARAKQLAKAQKRPFNPLSGASWRAASANRQARLKFQQDQIDKTNAGLQAERLNALRRGSRIIGYDKNDQPIYTQVPLRRSNRYMNAEAEARETDLRRQADDLKTENVYGALNDYLNNNNMRGRANRNASKMGDHYKALRMQMDAKRVQDEADERYYNETIMKAAERDSLTGKLKDVDAYNKYVRGAMGSLGYDINQKTEEGKRLAEQAAVSIIGDAYSRNESQRAQNIKRFEGYMDKQVTKEVLRQYEDMIKYDNVDGIVASHNILARRGDYDQIASHMRDYFNSGKVHLGEDASNVLAMNFLGMKDAAPALARLGKFINMETWQYTSGNRPAEVTMDQYVTGVVEGAYKSDGTPYTTRINLASGLEGTKLTGIDRTAYGALEALTGGITKDKNLSHDQAVSRRMAIEMSMLPQEISALPTFASGSEQIRSMVGHMTGMKFNSATNQWEDVLNKDRTPEEAAIEHEVVNQVMNTYLESLTARDLISMKSDTWAGMVARIKLDKAVEHGIDLEHDDANGTNNKRAEELAHEELRKRLGSRITKLASGNMNVDMMKEPIYKALHIGEERERLFRERQEKNQQIRDEVRRKGTSGAPIDTSTPPISADDGDGSDDLTE